MTHGMKSRDGRRKIRISYQSAICDTHQAIDICTRFARDIPGHVPPPAVLFNNGLVSEFVNSPSKQSRDPGQGRQTGTQRFRIWKGMLP
jgi:hypothetical protein